MNAADCRWSRIAVATFCAAAALCSAVPVSAQSLSGISAKRSATVDFKEAERRLQQAKLTRQRGKLPLAAEQVNDGGTRRLNENYARRQAGLERSLAAAERRHLETTVALQAFQSQR